MKNNFFKLGLIFIFALSLCIVSCPGNNDDGPVLPDHPEDVTPSDDDVSGGETSDPTLPPEDDEPSVPEDTRSIFEKAEPNTIFVKTVSLELTNDKDEKIQEDAFNLYLKKNEEGKICFEAKADKTACMESKFFPVSYLYFGNEKSDATLIFENRTYGDCTAKDCCGTEVPSDETLTFTLSYELIIPNKVAYVGTFEVSLADEDWIIFTPAE